MKNELLNKAWAAHGGLDRWNSFDKVHATIVTGGQLFDMKQTPQDSTPREMTVATRYEWASVTPFGSAGQHTDFTPNRIAIERSDGTVVSSRLHPAEHAEGKSVDAAWDALDRAYFNGYALWTYLTTPFLFAMQGFRSEEIAPWKEGTETWRGLRVTFPTGIASHSREQDFYFGADFLLRQHDYHVEASGGFAAAQYVFDNVTVQGITFPTRATSVYEGRKTPSDPRKADGIDRHLEPHAQQFCSGWTSLLNSRHGRWRGATRRVITKALSHYFRDCLRIPQRGSYRYKDSAYLDGFNGVNSK